MRAQNGEAKAFARSWMGTEIPDDESVVDGSIDNAVQHADRALRLYLTEADAQYLLDIHE